MLKLTILSHDNRDHVRRVITGLGGTAECSRLCDVRTQAVTYWRSAGMPIARWHYLRLLRPDVFERIEDEVRAEALQARQGDEAVTLASQQPDANP